MRLLKLLLVLLLAAAGCNGKGAFALNPKTAADRVAVKRLNQRFLSTELEHVALTEVIEFLRNASDVNIYVHWAALKANGLDRSTPVNLDIRDATPYEALITLLGSLESEEPITCALADGILVISTPEDSAVLAEQIRSRPSAGTTEADRAVLKKLRQRIRFMDFDDVELEDVLQFLRDVTGVNIYVNWRSLAAIGVSKNTTVNLLLENVSAHLALMVVLTDVRATRKATYTVADDVVVISTRENAERIAKLVRGRPRVKTIEERVAARRMNETVRELNFEDVELEDVIHFIQDVAGVGISVHWSRLQRVGLRMDTPINLRFGEVRLHTALILCLADVAADNALGYIIKEGRIHVSTPEGLKKLLEAPSRPQTAPGNQ